MPVHFDAIAPDNHESMAYSLMTKGLDSAEDVIESKDGRILHVIGYMYDSSKERIGKIVYTLLREEEGKELSFLDIDLTLDGADAVELEFLKKLPQSSDANEYYDVEAVAGGQHLQVETVNRNAVEEEITGTSRIVRCSAFPYQLSVFDDIDMLNESLGFIEKDQNGKIVSPSLAATFAAPGMGWTKDDEDSSPYSVLVGTVRNVRDVHVDLGGQTQSFTVAQIETALGRTPVGMNREVFDLDKLAPGKAVIMNAYVKADFATEQ